METKKLINNITAQVYYLDEVFRSKDFISFDEHSKYPWFNMAELIEDYNESPNLRVVEIIGDATRITYIQQIVAAFDDEATLIFINDNCAYEKEYAEINMYPISSDKMMVNYVYENAVGSYLLDKLAKKGE